MTRLPSPYHLNTRAVPNHPRDYWNRASTKSSVGINKPLFPSNGLSIFPEGKLLYPAQGSTEVEVYSVEHAAIGGYVENVDELVNYFVQSMNHASTKFSVRINKPLFPSKAFSVSPEGKLLYSAQGSTELEVSLLELAAIIGDVEEVEKLLDEWVQSMQGPQYQERIDYALFLAHMCGPRDPVTIKLEGMGEQGSKHSANDIRNAENNIAVYNSLLNAGANPGREGFSNGLHGIASQGLGELMSSYILDIEEFPDDFYGVDPDTLDEFGATPIMYAMQKEAPYDWQIIKSFIDLGAKPDFCFCIDSLPWSYADLARAMRKLDLAERLDEKVTKMLEDDDEDEDLGSPSSG